ncbi:MAG: amino acid permease [Pseudomonadota bacterium]|nr:amino acid permease [Pseudomonadota bacterium]
MSTQPEKQQLGPWMTTALVVGGIIGAGIFLLPVALAPFGRNAIIGWVISGAGVLCIGYALARLVTSDGAGLQAYVERSFGPTAGFLVAWSFCFSQWAANAALAIAAAAAISRIENAFAGPTAIALLAVGFIIFLTLVNALGARAMGRLAVVTTALKILPLVAAVVLVAVNSGQGRPAEALALMPVTFDNIAAAVALTLYALTGFENATAPVGKVRDPARTIPRAILLGTAFVALLYLLSSTAVLMLLPQDQAIVSVAPFADALATRWGETAAILAALGMAISAFGCLNGGIMVAGELGYSMALRGDLPRTLAGTNGTNTPVVGQLLASAVAILLVLLNSSRTTAGLFTFVILLSTVGALVIYLVGSIAALRLRPSGLATAIIVVGILFSLFAFYGAGLEANLWGVVLIAAGFVIRWLSRRFSSRATIPPAETVPAALPE